MKQIYDPSPCYKCTKPEKGIRCHGSCPDYFEWSLRNDDRRAEDKKNRANRFAIISPAYESMQKNAMRRKQQGRK